MNRTVPIFAGVIIMAAVAVIMGWVFDIDVLKRILPGFVTMKFSTALSFLFSGIILFFAWRRERPTQSDWADVMLPSASLLLSLLMGTALISVLLGFNSGIERLFIEDRPDAILTPVPGRPSMGTMLAFIAIAVLGIVAIGVWRGKMRFYRWLGGLVSILGLAALVGYLFDWPFLYYGVANVSTAMAVHTALLFTVVGAGFVIISFGRFEARDFSSKMLDS